MARTLTDDPANSYAFRYSPGYGMAWSVFIKRTTSTKWYWEARPAGARKAEFTGTIRERGKGTPSYTAEDIADDVRLFLRDK